MQCIIKRHIHIIQSSANPLCIRDVVDTGICLHLGSRHEPSRESDEGIPVTAKLPSHCFSRCCIFGPGDVAVLGLSLLMASHSKRCRSKATCVCQTCIQSGNSSAVSIDINDTNLFSTVCRNNREENGHHGVKATHLSAVQVAELVPVGFGSNLKGLICSGEIAGELCGVDRSGFSESSYHASVRTGFHFVNIIEVELRSISHVFQLRQQLHPILVGAAAASAEECRAFQDMDNVLLIILLHSQTFPPYLSYSLPL